MRSFALLVPATLLALAVPASAQPARFSVNNFVPAVNLGNNFYVTEGSRLLPHLSPSAALVLTYAHRPLRIQELGAGGAEHPLVRYHLTADVLVGIGFLGWLEVGLGLPMILSQESDGFASIGWPSRLSGGLGDIRLVPKARLLRAGPFNLALAASLAVPTGKDSDLLGADSVTFTPQLIGGLEWDRVGLALNAGYRVQKDASFSVPGGQSVVIDDEVTFSLAARVKVWRELELVGDLFGSIGTREQDLEEVPVELLAGVRYRFAHDIVATLGAGGGLTAGVGAPAARVLAGVAIQPRPEARKPPPPKPVDLDPDRDGIKGTEDGCPLIPEDKDGFEDEDGCPDLDNDRDGIPDKTDRCPNEPEDKDGFEDADGCPDLDNDKDGIPDKTDKCPNEPEDKDGFEDGDGCPDLDNDKDGIPDKTDRCPNEPEVVNGFEDEDGCPDVSKGPIQIEKGRIKVPTVYFATGRDVVLKRSLATLKRVAELLGKNPWVKRVRVEGHTDIRGKSAFNLDLSQRRAKRVMGHLLEYGVAADRLESEGYGMDRPIASNNSAKGRATNRRVDFIILDPAQPPASAPAP